MRIYILFCDIIKIKIINYIKYLKMEKNDNLNTFLFMNQNEYNPSSSSSDEESYESNEEQEDNDGNSDDV